MHSLAHGRALAEVCVVAVAGSFEGELRSSGLGCVGCRSRPQTAQKFQAFPASLWPLRFQQLLFFFFPFLFPFFSLWFLALSCFPFFSSTRGSPWQGAGEGERKWVSGSTPATGSGWLLSLCNWSPASPAVHPSTLQFINVPYFSQLFLLYLQFLTF